MRGKRAPLETFYFYPLPSPNVNSLGDDLFLSFAFCYGSLQIATNAKSICQSLWRCSKCGVIKELKSKVGISVSGVRAWLAIATIEEARPCPSPLCKVLLWSKK